MRSMMLAAAVWTALGGPAWAAPKPASCLNLQDYFSGLRRFPASERMHAEVVELRIIETRPGAAVSDAFRHKILDWYDKSSSTRANRVNPAFRQKDCKRISTGTGRYLKWYDIVDASGQRLKYVSENKSPEMTEAYEIVPGSKGKKLKIMRSFEFYHYYKCGAKDETETHVVEIVELNTIAKKKPAPATKGRELLELRAHVAGHPVKPDPSGIEQRCPAR